MSRDQRGRSYTPPAWWGPAILDRMTADTPAQCDWCRKKGKRRYKALTSGRCFWVCLSCAREHAAAWGRKTQALPNQLD